MILVWSLFEKIYSYGTTHKMTEDTGRLFIMSQQSIKRAASLVEVVSTRVLSLGSRHAAISQRQVEDFVSFRLEICSHTPTRFYRFSPISLYCATAWWNLGRTKSRHDATLLIQLPDSANELKPVMEGRKRPTVRDTEKPLITRFLSNKLVKLVCSW